MYVLDDCSFSAHAFSLLNFVADPRKHERKTHPEPKPGRANADPNRRTPNARAASGGGAHAVVGHQEHVECPEFGARDAGQSAVPSGGGRDHREAKGAQLAGRPGGAHQGVAVRTGEKRK